MHVAAAKINRRKHRNFFESFRRTFQHLKADTVDIDPDGSENRVPDEERRRTDRVTTDAGTPTRVATIVKPMSEPKKNEPPAWQTLPSLKHHRPRTATSRSQRSDPLYGRNTRRRRRGVAITHLCAGQATKDDRTSGPSPPSGLPD